MNGFVTIKRPGDDLSSGSYDKSIFLAGTIDNGNSINWQNTAYQDIKKCLANSTTTVRVYSPRNEMWTADANDEVIRKQIHWEMDRLNESDIIFMNILSDSKSPISLLELGHFANKKHMIVVCPKEFYRYVNVETFCDIMGINVFHSYEAGMLELIKKINA